MAEMNFEKMAHNVAEAALDSFEYYGKTIREWMNIITEQEPCDDVVSRQAVNTLVDELARAISDERCFMSRGRSTATIMQDILDLPSVIQKSGWIPVSEGLPEEGQSVIVSTKYGVYPEARYTKEYGWEWAYEAGADYWRELEGVIAWMPLPEPYKTESEESDGTKSIKS